MRLDRAFIRLPLRFDPVRLAAEVAARPDEEWLPHPQGFVGNRALLLVAAEGDPTDDRIAGPMAETPALRASPTLRQVLASLGCPIGRTRLAGLDPGAVVTEHVDTHDYWHRRVRVHIPVLTDPDVTFYCGSERAVMGAGECWIFDTWRPHSVANRSRHTRVHLVIDTVGSPGFWRMVAAGGEDHQVSLDQAEPELDLEQAVQPPVMTVEELVERIEALTGEAQTAAGVPAEVLAALDGLAVAWPGGGEAALQRTAVDLEPWRRKIRLPNGVDLIEALHALVLRPALDRPPPKVARCWRDRFDRPVFVVCPPRSGSSLLFETLSGAPDVYTVGGEAHAAWEVSPLGPEQRGWSSNRLTAADLDPAVERAITAALDAQLRDRAGQPPASGPVTLLEKTPKNSLRVPFLAGLDPDARFLLLHREPRDVVSSMLDGWRSGGFVTYPGLPGWRPERWSFLLVPGWRERVGQPLADVVAWQWASTVSILLDDLEALDPERVGVVSYARLVAEPDAEIAAACRWLGWSWDRPLGGAPLPLSAHTLTAPEPEKWRRNAVELEIIEPILRPLRARFEDVAQRLWVGR